MNIKTISAALVTIAVIAWPSLGQTLASSPLAPPATSNQPLPKTQANQFRLGHLTVTGNIQTKLFVILRMIPLNEGDVFNQSLWDFGIDQINRSGLFEPIEPKDVVMKPDNATGLVDVELHVTERKHQRVDLSGGGGTTGGCGRQSEK